MAPHHLVAVSLECLEQSVVDAYVRHGTGVGGHAILALGVPQIPTRTVLSGERAIISKAATIA